MVKKTQIIELRKLIKSSLEASPVTRLPAQKISKWVIISFTLNPNIFTDVSRRIGTCMCDICTLDDNGVLG